MNSDDLTAIRKRADAATPGPWEAGDVWVFTDPVYPDDKRLSNVLGMPFADDERNAREHQRGLTNAEFMAHAREDVPALLARLAAAEKVIQDAPHADDCQTAWNAPDYDVKPCTCWKSLYPPKEEQS